MLSPDLSRRTIALVQRFRRTERGNVAIIFGLALAPTLFLVGAATDYSGASELAVRLQTATDATSLMLCQVAGTPSQSQMEATAQTNMQGYMGATPFALTAVNYSTFPRSVQLTTSATFKTAFVSAFGPPYRNIPVTATAACVSQLQSYEIALVLDNTGSMANSSGGVSKMQALQSAATNFVNSVYASANMGPNTKISLVPFAAGVAVTPGTYRTASWVDTAGGSPINWNFVQGGAATAAAYRGYGINSRFDVFNYLKGSVAAWDWTGCFESVPYPLNVQDGKPVSSNPNSYYVPMFAADESGNGGQFTHTDGSGNTVNSANSYIDDTNGNCAPTTNEATRTGQACKYMTITNPQTSNGYFATGPNFACTTRPLTRLTNAQSMLTSEISQMRANGNTNVHEGLMWGWRTLSPNSVFADGAAYTKPYNNKILILMTDGMNTWGSNSSNPTLKSMYSAYGFYVNPDGTKPNDRLPSANANPANDAQARAAIDALTLEACQNARNAGVVIYTIGFSVASDPMDQPGIDMLTSCAGDATRAYMASDASTIDTVFQQIAASIGKLRLSR